MLRQFFATADDLLPVFDQVESKRSLTYTLMGLFAVPNLTCVERGVSIPTLRARLTHPNASNGPQYLVSPVDVPVAIREVPQHAGGIRYAVDQLINPDSVVLLHGGFFRPEILLYGSIGTASVSPVAKALYRAFANSIAKVFSRNKGYWVGPEAVELLNRGCRLTIGADSPQDYDLVP
jgi:hypothetical protein